MKVLIAVAFLAARVAALHPVEKSTLSADSSENSMMLVVHTAVADPWWTGAVVGTVVVVAAAAGIYFYMNKDKQTAEDVEADSMAEQKTALTSEALTSQAEDMMEKAKEKFGSKLTADGDVVQILQGKAQGFGDRLKALVMNEMNSAASSVGKALEADDCAAILEWDSNISANFPSLSVLLAGLLVPVNLSINYACHVSQVFLVLLPIGIVTALSEYADRAHPCTSIPGLRLWARITACTVLVVMCCRLIMMKRITNAQRDLCAKSEAVRSKLAHLEKDPRDLSFTDLRDLFAAHASTLQQAVVCESYCTSPIMSHIIGFGTLIWLLSTFYNTYLYFAYMFVPGRVTLKLFSCFLGHQGIHTISSEWWFQTFFSFSPWLNLGEIIQPDWYIYICILSLYDIYIIYHIMIIYIYMCVCVCFPPLPKFQMVVQPPTRHAIPPIPPGVVAFHPAAAEDPSYCAAWVTVCASKVALLVAVLFFFMNLATWKRKRQTNNGQVNFGKNMSKGSTQWGLHNGLSLKQKENQESKMEVDKVTSGPDPKKTAASSRWRWPYGSSSPSWTPALCPPRFPCKHVFLTVPTLVFQRVNCWWRSGDPECWMLDDLDRWEWDITRYDW